MVLQKLAITAPTVSTEVILLWSLKSSDVEDYFSFFLK